MSYGTEDRRTLHRTRCQHQQLFVQVVLWNRPKGIPVQTTGIVSLILLGIIGLGAFKVWRLLVGLFSKPFSTPNLTKIRKVAFLIVALVVVSMLTPFLLPFNSTLRLVIYGAYALFAVLGLSQIWDWVSSLLNRGKTPANK